MAKEKEATTAVAKKEDDQFVEIGNQSFNLNQIIENVGSMKEGAVLSSEYWTPEPGDSYRVVFAGMSTMKKMNGEEGDKIDAIRLFFTEGKDKQGKFFKNADKVLVSTCRDFPEGKAVKIECTGWEQSPKGKYRQFTVTDLKS